MKPSAWQRGLVGPRPPHAVVRGPETPACHAGNQPWRMVACRPHGGCSTGPRTAEGLYALHCRADEAWPAERGTRAQAKARRALAQVCAVWGERRRSQCQPEFADEGGVRLSFSWSVHDLDVISYGNSRIFVFALAQPITTSTAASALNSVYHHGTPLRAARMWRHTTNRRRTGF